MSVESRLATNGIVVKNNFALFFGGIFSNWYKSKFTLGDLEFNCVEQYMMAQKAIQFRDARSLKAIMMTSDPQKQKAIGREVKDYDDKAWKRTKYPVVVKGVFAKFDQNPHLLTVLLETNPLIIVEASPYDSIYGIAMGADHADITNPGLWKGENLLGIALMDVRATLFNIQDD